MTEQNENETLRFTLAGTPEEIKSQLTSLMAQYQMSQETGGNFYAIPCESFHQTVRIYPQIALVFREEKADAQKNNRPRHPLRSVVTIRVMADIFSDTFIKELAQKVASKFAKPPFFFYRGEQFWSYADRSRGYFFQVYVQDEANAKKIIEQAMDIQVDSPDWDVLKYHQQKYKNWNNKEYFTLGTERIRKPRLRPKGKVVFTHAELKLPGLTEDVILVDRMGQYPNPYVIA
ncbi:MAG: hypothetical protein SAJ12_07265 [Jaaginema sp. PMC 1079.18]|nr:hypothetical protein [Jaaginema sp. PMC 1080.18]MEC4850796.1 hypothetical protein [Jaaginema sp. PMC 1079.18]MEC4868167.1 hypothetical protein [Jaaginema sp. PMC 1078.18]